MYNKNYKKIVIKLNFFSYKENYKKKLNNNKNKIKIKKIKI